MLAHIHLHPIIVHFPIALFISAMGLEVLGLVFKKEILRKAAWVNYVLGVIGAFFAVLSAWIENEEIKHPVFYTHRALGYWTLGISFIGLFFRRYRILFLIAAAALVAAAGWYGGRLVYEYGVGVSE